MLKLPEMLVLSHLEVYYYIYYDKTRHRRVEGRISSVWAQVVQCSTVFTTVDDLPDLKCLQAAVTKSTQWANTSSYWVRINMCVLSICWFKRRRVFCWRQNSNKAVQLISAPHLRMLKRFQSLSEAAAKKTGDVLTTKDDLLDTLTRGCEGLKSLEWQQIMVSSGKCCKTNESALHGAGGP